VSGETLAFDERDRATEKLETDKRPCNIINTLRVTIKEKTAESIDLLEGNDIGIKWDQIKLILTDSKNIIKTSFLDHAFRSDSVS
jgi:hypothetical protein